MIASFLSLALAATAPGGSSERQVAFEINYAALLEQQDATVADETAIFLREDATKALETEYRAQVVQSIPAPAIVVKLEWIEYSQSLYRITVYTRRVGEQPLELESFECSCIDSGVSESVLARLPQALEQLDEGEAVTEVVPEEAAGPEPAAEPQEGEPPREPGKGERRASLIGALGISGAVVAATGVGVLGFGISRLARGEELTADGQDEEQGLGRDFRPQGMVWTTVGAVATLAGSALLVVDLTVLRQRRRQRVAVGPVVGPTWSGLAVRGRF